MMTSWYEPPFRITGAICEENHPHPQPHMAFSVELRRFFVILAEETVEQTLDLQVIRDVMHEHHVSNHLQ